VTAYSGNHSYLKFPSLSRVSRTYTYISRVTHSSMPLFFPSFAVLKVIFSEAGRKGGMSHFLRLNDRKFALHVRRWSDSNIHVHSKTQRSYTCSQKCVPRVAMECRARALLRIYKPTSSFLVLLPFNSTCFYQTSKVGRIPAMRPRPRPPELPQTSA
jgi:hypothetical protein